MAAAPGFVLPDFRSRWFGRLVAPVVGAVVASSVVGVVWPAAASAAPVAPAAEGTAPAAGAAATGVPVSPAPEPGSSPVAGDPPGGTTFRVDPSSPVFDGAAPAPQQREIPASASSLACTPNVPASLSETRKDTYQPELFGILTSSCSADVAGFFTVKDQASGQVVYRASGIVDAGDGIGTRVFLGQLRVGVRYVWSMRACFGADCSAETATRPLVLNPMLGAGSRSVFTSDTFTVSSRLTAKVNVGSGNLELSAPGIDLVGASRSLTLGAAYNSAALQDGAPAEASGQLGPGWRTTHGADYQITTLPSGTATVYGPGGTTWGFSGNPPVGSAYTPPPGADATLVKNADGTWTFTEHASARRVRFTASGRVSNDDNRNGSGFTVAYATSGERVTTVTADAGPGSGYAVTAGYAASGPTRLTILSQSGTGVTTRTVTYGYDSSNRLQTITDAASRVTTFGYDSAGRVSKITSPSGRVTDITYEAVLGRVASITQDPTGINAKTSYVYTEQPGTWTDATTNTESKSTVKVTAPNDQGSTRVTTYSVDYGGRVRSATDPLGRARSRTYNNNANVLTATDATNRTTTNTYTNSGESLASTAVPTGATSSLTYTTAGCSGSTGGTVYQAKCGSNFSGQSSTYSYNGAGNLTSNKDGTAATAAVAYNANGTPASSTDPINQASANRTVYTYNTSKQLQTLTPPTGNSLAARSFTYDGFGRLKTVTTGRGITTTYGYNADDETTGINYSDATVDIAHTYSSDGDLTVQTGAAGTTGYSYDKLGRTTGKNTASATVGCPTSPSTTRMCYGYDKNGNLTSSADGRGTTTYGYDAANQLTSMVEGRDGTRILFDYDDNGRQTDRWTNTPATTIPPASFALHQKTTYDNSGRLRNTVVTRNSSDAAGNRVIDDTVCYTKFAAGQTTCAAPTGTAPDRGQRQWRRNNLTGIAILYTYDSAGRLTGVDRQDAGTDYGYCYDADGNITKRTTTVPPACTGLLTYNSGNQQTGTGAPTHDADGNITASPSSTPALTTLTYDGADRTTAITPSGGSAQSAVYAGPDTTERRTFGGTTFGVGAYGIQSDTVAGVQHWFELDPTSGTPLAVSYGSSAATHGYAYIDALGNLAGMIDAAGTVAATYTYGPYGALLTQTGTLYNPWRYKTGYTDTTTGLTKYGNRYYDPTTGRWTQQDSLTFLNNPAQGNRYAAFGSDPVNIIDPTGRNTIAVTGQACYYGVCLGASYQGDQEGSGGLQLSIGAGTPGFAVNAGFEQESISPGWGWQVTGGAGPLYGGYGSSGASGGAFVGWASPYVAFSGTYTWEF